MRVEALIPAYQAASSVADVVLGASRHVDRVVVVDDGSTDGTSEAARAAGATVLRLPQNCGKGSAIRAGLEEILSGAATHVAFLDADGQHDPEDLPAMTEAASRDAFVIGSRMSRADEIPAYRFRTNEIGSRILSRMSGHDIEDGQSGYRLIRADLLRRLDLSARGYSIETEILLKSAPHVPRFRHVPIRVIYGGPSHYRPFTDTWKISWAAVYYKVFECD